MTVRVHYPLEGSTLVLRHDGDWERDVEPTGGDAAGTRCDFRIDFDPDRPFRYFKPQLLRGASRSWALGENFLALRNGRTTMDVYPWFFDTRGCSACDVHHVSSRSSGRTHAVRVFYPAGYHENLLERYPVIYMQDAQNLFFPDEAFGGHDWMIDETLDVLGAMNLVRRAIIVGIYPVDRMADYTKPGYEEYGRFLVEDVRPWVGASYRALDGPRNTAVMGSSLGGVVSFYLAWQHPDVFGHAACLSSTFGFRDDLAARVAAEPRRPLRIYLDSGWPQDNYEVTRNMRNQLVERGYVEGRDLLYLAFPHARHNEQAWAMRAHIPLQHFFGRP
jgi:predicted alpha/beta superfamily hydrolase